MGDWTSGTATIHSCPPNRVRRVLDAFVEYGLASEDDDAADDRAAVNVGESYGTDEFRCGSALDLSNELILNAPEVAFTVYEEPAYEWVGTTCTYVPGLGLFIAACDTCGSPMFTQSEVLGLEGEPADTRRMALGVPWLTAIAAMPPATVVEPDRFAAHWNRRHGEVIVVEGKQCGGDLIFTAPVTAAEVDMALAERGFQRAEDWTQLDEPGQLWRTDVYRFPSP